MPIELSYDHAGAWMAAIKSLGVDTNIVFGRVEAGGSDPTWYALSHSDYDGIGAFVTLLRQQGYPDLQVPATYHYEGIPRTRNVLQAGVRFTALAAIQRGAAVLNARRSPPQPAKPAWHLFSTEQTRALADRAMRDGATLNSLLLFTLARACKPLCNSNSRFSNWMIPINMRGPIRLPRDTANHVAYIRVAVSDRDSAKSVNAKVRSRLWGNEHWFLWYCLRYGSYLGRALMRFLADVDMKFGNSLIGSFSNIGEWNVPGSSRWLVCPPAAKAMPIGAGCLVCNNQLGLTLQIEPHYQNANELAAAAMKNWVRECAVLR